MHYYNIHVFYRGKQFVTSLSNGLLSVHSRKAKASDADSAPCGLARISIARNRIRENYIKDNASQGTIPQQCNLILLSKKHSWFSSPFIFCLWNSYQRAFRHALARSQLLLNQIKLKGDRIGSIRLDPVVWRTVDALWPEYLYYPCTIDEYMFYTIPALHCLIMQVVRYSIIDLESNITPNDKRN